LVGEKIHLPPTKFTSTLFIDSEHWIKCGIEFCDGQYRLSVVVCNVFRDWSTQIWPSSEASFRIHTVGQSSSLAIEVAQISSKEYELRILMNETRIGKLDRMRLVLVSRKDVWLNFPILQLGLEEICHMQPILILIKKSIYFLHFLNRNI
jgi:hypothetical protein